MNEYYTNQANYPVFRSIKFQRGYGLGGVFKKLFKWIMPIFKEKAMPILRSVGESVIKGTTNLAKDTLKGRNVRESAKDRFEETLNELSDKAGVMRGDGMGSMTNTPINNKKKRILNIISKKYKK